MRNANNDLRLTTYDLQPIRVLAVDPGYDRVGIAVAEKKSAGKDELLYSACFTTNRSESFYKRLAAIGAEILSAIDTYAPTTLAIEELFFNTNQTTAMRVAEVRGMIIYLAGVHNVPVVEFTPSQVKQAVTGYGKSSKKDMEKMLPLLTTIEKRHRLDDEYDAIAIALTCLATRTLP